MKTTLEINDGIYRQVKARAALEGATVRSFFLSALKEKLESGGSRRRKPAGWRAVFGKASSTAAKSVQHLVDQEFSRIDPRDWK